MKNNSSSLLEEENEKNENKENEGDKNSNKVDFINCILFSKYKVIKKLTEGNFSSIYQAINNEGDNFCCKIEPINSPQLLLENESKIMDYLRGRPIPNIKLYGQSGDHNILIMDLLGKSLDYYIKKLGKFSIKTTVMLAYQMIDILKFIHIRHIIHRDIKPGNFIMGLGKSCLDLFIIDFGFAKKYRSNKTYKLNPMTIGHKLTGTARYASINAMKGLEQSCRDDLESLAYVLYFFLRGDLPWQGIKEIICINNDESNFDKIYDWVDKQKVIKDNLPKNETEKVTFTCCDESNFDKIYDWVDKQKVIKDNLPKDETEKVTSTCCKM